MDEDSIIIDFYKAFTYGALSNQKCVLSGDYKGLYSECRMETYSMYSTYDCTSADRIKNKKQSRMILVDWTKMN